MPDMSKGSIYFSHNANHDFIRDTSFVSHSIMVMFSSYSSKSRVWNKVHMQVIYFKKLSQRTGVWVRQE